VTNFWDPAQMQSETAIGTALMKAARAAGVHHLIWSTLPILRHHLPPKAPAGKEKCRQIGNETYCY